MKLAIGAITLMTLAALYAAFPRSVRNNNPLNIREGEHDHTQWEGEAIDNRDRDFEEFENPIMGFRAAGKILLNYQRIHGLTTIEQMINRWAPPSENNTTSYINHVAKALNVPTNAHIKLDENTLTTMLHTMSAHESGYLFGKHWFSEAQARAGAQLALTT